MRNPDDFKKLQLQGLTNREIAIQLNCSIKIVTYYLIYRDIEIQKRKLHAKPKTVKDLNSKIRNRKFLDNYLKNHPCIDCGNSDLRVLDFDHVRGEKVEDVSHAVRNNWSIIKIQKEIDKCEVRCSNCHRIVTYERRKLKKLK
jgi:hypothetical protein